MLSDDAAEQSIQRAGTRLVLSSTRAGQTSLQQSLDGRKWTTLRPLPDAAWLRVAFVLLALGCGAWYLHQVADSEDWWLHGTWCFVGLGAAAPMIVRGLRRGFGALFVDHRIIFLSSFSLYFLFGASLLAVGPEIQVRAALDYYPIGAQEALRVDAMNALGCGIALLSASIVKGRGFGMHAARAATWAAGIPVQTVVALFLVLGIAASAYVLSYDLGYRQGLVPGVVRNIGKLAVVAVFLAAAYRGRLKNTMRFVAVGVAALLTLVGAVQFSKTEMLIPTAALLAGLGSRYGLRRVLPLGLMLLVVGYIAISTTAAEGRATLARRGGGDMLQRWQIFQAGWQNREELPAPRQYGTWARLCYTPPQAAGLDLWDRGLGGDGISMLPWVFVPRVLAPGKPEITKTGRELHEKITGQSLSQSGQGIFASGYYAGGWWGFGLASVLCGWILAQTTAMARAILSSHAALFLPLCLLALYMAFRIDGDFVSDYIGTFVFMLYPVMAASLLLAPQGLRPRSS